MKTIKILFLSLFTGIALSSCHQDMDDVINQSGVLEINDFIWKGMNNIYLYKADVPDLADDRFSNQDELNDFLEEFSTPESLFYDALVAPYDDFSFLVDNYIELENYLNGIRLSHGMQYGLIRYSSTSDYVFGYVRYILPNTSAAEQGLKRGDIFNTVDGVQLTTENFRRLLEPASYTIGLAELEGMEVNSTGETVGLQKVQYTSNPVFLAKTIEIPEGKVGYLIYNAFTGTFDPELNQAFAMFQAEGITDLILDFRYNGGGSVESAVDLASMVTGQFEGETFVTQQWNKEYQAYFEDNEPERLVNVFNSRIRTGELINSLGLDQVYVITTLRTASASELVINGLNPYIDVVQVGERTTGKFQASVTLYDSDDFGRQGVNPGHTYAIQPLVYKSINSAGVSDYHDGLPPDVEIEEDVRNLGVLGEPNEPLLQAALNAVQGTQQAIKKPYRKFKFIGENGMDSPLYQRMYSENLPPRLSF